MVVLSLGSLVLSFIGGDQSLPSGNYDALSLHFGLSLAVPQFIMTEAAYIRRLLTWICVPFYKDVYHSKLLVGSCGFRCFLSPKNCSLHSI